MRFGQLVEQLERLSPRRRRGALVFAAVGAGLVPWSAVLAAALPSTTTARHWNLAWYGLDLGEATAATTTAWMLARHDQRAAQSAAVLATLLCVDAWFDVCTASPGLGLAVAVAEAALLELPLAAAAAWTAAHLGAETRPPGDLATP